MTLGCGGEPQWDGEEQFGVQSHAFKEINDGTPDVVEIDGFSMITFQPHPMTGSPALTAADHHLFVAMQKRASTNTYWGFSGQGTQNGSWGELTGSTTAFRSPPAIARLPKQGEECRVMIVGRRDSTTAANRKLYWTQAKITLTNPNTNTWSPPSALHGWLSVDSNTFDGDYGFPALASKSNGDVAIAYINPSSNVPRVYAQRKVGGTWDSRVIAPVIPSYNPVGTPAIAYSGPQGRYAIVVRAQRSGVPDRLYRIFFSGTSFGSWAKLDLADNAMRPQSNPALEWEDELAAYTVYFRNDTSIYQSSFTEDVLFEPTPLRIVSAGVTPSFVDSPAVNGNFYFEPGKHWILARNLGGALYFAETLDDSLLEP